MCCVLVLTCKGSFAVTVQSAKSVVHAKIMHDPKTGKYTYDDKSYGSLAEFVQSAKEPLHLMEPLERGKPNKSDSGYILQMD